LGLFSIFFLCEFIALWGCSGMKNYHDIIRNPRNDKNLTQAEIANILGTTQQHYSKYENNTNEMPIKVLVRLADYYGVSTDYLLGRAEMG